MAPSFGSSRPHNARLCMMCMCSIECMCGSRPVLLSHVASNASPTKNASSLNNFIIASPKSYNSTTPTFTPTTAHLNPPQAPQHNLDRLRKPFFNGSMAVGFVFLPLVTSLELAEHSPSS